MGLLGQHRDGIKMSAIHDQDQFGLVWRRLLFPTEVLSAFHAQPASGHIGPTADLADSHAAPQVDGHAEPTLSIPIDADSVAADSALDGLGAGPAQGVPGPGDDAATPADDPIAHPPPYLLLAPLTDASHGPAPAPGDAAPAGFIPKSEAIIWSGPAIIAFPADAHDSAGGDLSAAFLPADGGDPTGAGHGLDPGFAFAPPPLPPPPPDFF